MGYVNEKINSHEDTLQKYLKKYGTMSILENGQITYSIGVHSLIAARELYYSFKKNPAFALEFERNKLEDKGVTVDSLQNLIFIAFTRGTTDTFIYLKEFFLVIKEYTINTLNSVSNQRYMYPLELLADILCIETEYIKTNLMQYLDYIVLPNYYICYIIEKYIETEGEREHNLQNDYTNYSGRHYFISRTSLVNFLIEHLKYIEIRINIAITFKEHEFKQLLLKYKTKAKLKSQIKNILKIKDNDINKELKSIKEEEALDIINKRLILSSPDTIKQNLKHYKEEKLSILNKDYSHVRIRCAQLNTFLKNKSLKRYQLDINGIENKPIVRYHLYNNLEKEAVNYMSFNINQEMYTEILVHGTLEDFLISKL